jgi:hypothetical protein
MFIDTLILLTLSAAGFPGYRLLRHCGIVVQYEPHPSKGVDGRSTG